MLIKLSSYFKLLRPYQSIKNILVFPLFILSFRSIGAIVQSLDLLLIFISFSFVASSVYCANDLFDYKSDRKHPTKKNRPIASGDVSLKEGFTLSLVFLSFGVFISLFVSLNFFFIICSYLSLNILYNLIFKKFIFLDVFTLTFFYMLRIIAPSSLPYVDLSFWFITFSFFLFLSLAFLKKFIDFKYKKYRDIDSSHELRELFLNFSLLAFITSLSVLISFFNSSEFLLNYQKIYFIYALIIPYLYWMLNLITAVKLGFVTGDPILFALTDKKSLMSIGIASLIFIYSVL